MKLKLTYKSRETIMKCLDEGIIEVNQIKEKINIESELRIRSDKQLSRCIASINVHHKAGHRPRQVQGLY